MKTPDSIMNMGRRLFFIISFVCTFTTVLLSQNDRVRLQPIDEKRVAEIIPLLADDPAGFGEPANKRDIWDELYASGSYDTFMKQMNSFTFPPFSEEDYFSLSNGTASSSAQGLNMMRNRAKGLSQLTWAECLEDKGRFIPEIENGLKDILKQKSWVSPRNDFDFRNYNGLEYSVELTTALYAHTISQTLYLLGHKLDKKLYDDVVKEVYKRVFNPVLEKIKTQNTNRENQFLVMTNNYNHVCLAGVVGAALTLIRDKHERAVFAYIGEYYSQNGLAGFGDDGYCSEGIGYFNYGFGRFVQLRECLWQATSGKIDLFDNPKVEKIAHYPVKMEIMNDVFPSISDSRSGVKPEHAIMYYVNRNFRMGIDKYENVSLQGQTNDNRISVMMVFPNSASRIPISNNKKEKDEILRSFFEKSAVLIVRPLPASESLLGVAIKGGNNKEHHNHNDVGSYTVVWNDEIMAGDPGVIPYTADIFNEKFRYTYKTIGSYGHPVPLVAGKEQKVGSDAKAVILNTEYTLLKDAIKMDICSAYDVPQLKKLERQMTYSREGKGQLSIQDSFSYSSPQRFETAIITRSRVKKIADNELLLEGERGKLKVTFDSIGIPLSVSEESISEGGTPYTRIAISTVAPVEDGNIIVRYQFYEE